jgi:hypothetical protein
MKRINSYQELQQERLRAKERIRQLENQIEDDFSHWNVKNVLEDLFVSKSKNGILGESIGLTVDTILKKLLLRRFSWPLRFLASYFAKNYARNMYSKKSGNIYNWIVDKISNLTHDHSHRKMYSEIENNM